MHSGSVRMLRAIAVLSVLWVVEAGRCNDRSDSCANWARMGECSKNEGLAFTCPLSCRICTLECEETEPSCLAWAKDGECENNPGHMLKGAQPTEPAPVLSRSLTHMCEPLYAYLFMVQSAQSPAASARQPSAKTRSSSAGAGQRRTRATKTRSSCPSFVRRRAGSARRRASTRTTTARDGLQAASATRIPGSFVRHSRFSPPCILTAVQLSRITLTASLPTIYLALQTRPAPRAAACAVSMSTCTRRAPTPIPHNATSGRIRASARTTHFQ